MVEISSPEKLKDWLKDKPVNWAQVLTCRIALRTMPLINEVVSQSEFHYKNTKYLTISVSRALLISGVAAYSSTPEISNAAARAAYTADAARAADAADAADAAVYAALAAAYTADAAYTVLSDDMQWLQTSHVDNNSPQQLLALPLWHDNQNPLNADWQALKQSLLALDPNWQFWVDWYQAKLDGTQHPGLKQAQQNDLYYKIATFPNHLWEEGAEAVNQHIAELMESYQSGEEAFFDDTFLDHDYFGSDEPIEDFFLSYSTCDEAIAKKVSQIISQEGHSVFAQFKDMPVGSNFITEMQEGLENSSRFICLYSENYWTSDYCQQEWNTAITFDPSGKGRKIIPFLISECSIPPLARPLVYKNLIGLNNEDFREAVLAAIEHVNKRTKEQARKLAKETISPEPFINDDLELDIRANEIYDQQRETEDLYNLPDEQITLIDSLLCRIKGSNIVPKEIVLGFEQYRSELVKKGLQPNISLLNNLMKIIELDIEASEIDEWKSKQTDILIEQIGENHTKFQSHFPLDMVREENYRDAPMEVEKFNDDKFNDQINSLDRVFKEIRQEQVATDRFLENRQYEYEQIQQLLNLDVTRLSKVHENAVIHPEKEINFDEYKKRRLIQAASFADKLTEVLEKSDKVIKNPSAKYLLQLTKDLADWLWS